MSKEDYAKQFFKTRICRFFTRGKCSKGSDCSHAHSHDELHLKPNLIKTSLCRHYSSGRICEKGEDCPYAHGVSELRIRTQQMDVSDQASFSGSNDEASTDPDLSVRTGFATPPRAVRDNKSIVSCKRQVAEVTLPRHNLKDPLWPQYQFAPESHSPPTVGLAAYQYPFVHPSQFSAYEEDCSPHHWFYQD